MSVEVALYAAFFVLCLFVRPKLFILFPIALIGHFVVGEVYLPLGRGILSFFLGGCVYLIYARLVNCRSIRSISYWLMSVAAVFWLCTIVSFTIQSQLLKYLWRFPVFVLFPITILALATFETYRGTLGKRISIVGDISYSTYLLHFPLQLLFMVITQRLGLGSQIYCSGVVFLIYFFVLVGLCIISHRYFEVPIQNRIRTAFLGQKRSSAHLEVLSEHQ